MKTKILFSFIFLFVISCAKEKKKVDSLLDTLPKNTFLLLKVNSLDSLNHKFTSNALVKKFKKFAIGDSIQKKCTYLNYIKPKNTGLVSFSAPNDSSFAVTYAVKNDSILLVADDTIAIKTSASIEAFSIADTKIYATRVKNYSILSSSETALKDFENDIADDNLKKLFNTSGINKVATVFMNLSMDNVLVNSIFKEGASFNFGAFTDWVSLDFDLFQNKINLNGISIPIDSTNNLLNLFKKTNPLTKITTTLAPKQSTAIQLYSFDDYKSFEKNQRQFLKENQQNDSLFQTVEEIGVIHLNKEKAYVINTYGSQDIQDYLNSIKQGTSEFQGNEILLLDENNLLEENLTPIIKNYKAKFCTIIENAFIFSEQKNILEKIIRSHKIDNSFSSTTSYQALASEFAEESTSLFIAGSKHITDFLRKNAKPKIASTFIKEDFSKYAFGVQTVAANNFSHVNISINKINIEKKGNAVSKVFSSNLSNEIIGIPQLVLNHNSKKNEVVVQDTTNTLHLISSSGEILWSKQLSGPIQGKIHQVDLYKNGRLQLAFTTNKSFLILDRNGKEVAPFTINFEEGNLNPLAVFDYENRKDYRFVITQGKKVFMYNNKGKIVKGFTYTKAEHPIIAEPKHLVIQNKDYIVFKLDDGALKILSRTGKVRTKVNTQIDFSENNVLVYQNKFTISDEKGILYQIAPNGKITQNNLNLGKYHGIDATSKTLVIMNENILDIKGKKIELEMGIYSKPQIFYLNNKIYVTVTDIQNQKIYLFNSLGKPINDFPIFGTSVIDMAIDGNKKVYLVTKDNDTNLSVYKL